MSSLRLNVGAGAATVAGWVNLDASPSLLVAKALPRRVLRGMAAALPRPRREALEAYLLQRDELVWGDARRRLPMGDGEVEAIYSSHFLEHVRRGDALRFLRECHRVLRTGGILRIVVPDLRRLAEQYVGMSPGPRLSADEFVAATLLAEPERPRLAASTLSALWDRAGHLWMYDAESLCALLREAGFASPRQCAFRVGDAPDLEKLDIPERAHESVYVEAHR